MKTHSYYTTPIATTPGIRSRATMLTVLVILAAVTFALIFALRLARNSTVVIPTPSTRSAPIGSCRACRDEWIAAMQPSGANVAPVPADNLLRQAVPGRSLKVTRQLAGVSRVFRDEILAADQANLGSISLPSGLFESQQDEMGKSGPR
jgi:hypothetical protein